MEGESEMVRDGREQESEGDTDSQKDGEGGMLVYREMCKTGGKERWHQHEQRCTEGQKKKKKKKKHSRGAFFFIMSVSLRPTPAEFP